MAPTISFMADQLAQDAFDADLNKTVFLVALAFAIIIQTCVTAYLAWLVVRRCRSRATSAEAQEETERGEESMKSSPHKSEDQIPSHTPALSRHHRQPSLVISTSISQTYTSEGPDWTCPPQQIDLERASPSEEPASQTEVTECDIPRIVIQDEDSPPPSECTLPEPNPHYLYVPPTSCFAPRHLVESPNLPSLSHNPLLNGRPPRKLSPRKKRTHKPRVNGNGSGENANANAKRGMRQVIGAALWDISNVARLRPVLPLNK